MCYTSEHRRCSCDLPAVTTISGGRKCSATIVALRVGDGDLHRNERAPPTGVTARDGTFHAL